MFWRVGRTVMQRIANPYYVFKRRVGSTPTLSAIAFIMLLVSNASAYENEIKFLEKYVPVEWNGYYCGTKLNYNTVYLPLANKIEICSNNIVEKFGKDNLYEHILNGLFHEAIHLAQDCKAGFNNKQMYVLDENNVKYIPVKIKNIYNKIDYEIETEADMYENPNALSYVSKYCKRV